MIRRRYKDATLNILDRKYFLSMRGRVICLFQNAHLISYVPPPSCRHIPFPLLSTCPFFTPSYREEWRREFVPGITMNRDCQPANCDITPPSGSLRAVSGGRGADAGAEGGERLRTLVLVDGSENEIPRRGGLANSIHLCAGTHSART